MKFILISVLAIFAKTMFSQQETFEQQWKLTQGYIADIDSSCTSLIKQKNNFRSKKSLSKFVATNTNVQHLVMVRYKNGNYVVNHLYKNGSEKKIRVLYVNDKIVMVEMTWHTFTNNSTINNSFVKHNDELWYWTFKKKQGRKVIQISKKSNLID